VLSYELVRTTLRDNRFQIPPGYILAVQGITSGPLWDKVVNSLLGMEGAQHQRVRSVVSKAFTPPSGRASTRHDRGCDRRNSLNQPSGSVRRRHRDRAALPRAHHLRPARRASQRLATVFILDRTDMVARRHRCRLRHGGLYRGARTDAPASAPGGRHNCGHLWVFRIGFTKEQAARTRLLPSRLRLWVFGVRDPLAAGGQA
jgi:hypothetical protein